jgi:1,4-alpha-glucan branching enzyme
MIGGLMAKAKVGIKSTTVSAKNSPTGTTTTFEYKANTGLKVFVAGSFNDWRPTEFPMEEQGKSGHYTTSIKLAPGVHAYKIIVGDKWHPDPKNPDKQPDGHGGHNSVLVVT